MSDKKKREISDEVLLSVRGLEKSFDGNEVLKGIDLDIRKGEVISIIGPSGCGKSTFIRSLNLLETPDRGSIIFEGEELTGKKTAEQNRIRERIGMVFQQFNLFKNMTVLENIMLAPLKLGLMDRETAAKEAAHLLDRVGLADKADNYPAQLSGGQQQRVAIARSLAMKPDVMLFDEPDSGLDFKAAKTIFDFMEECKKEGKTIIFSSHSMENIKNYSDRIVVLHKGEIRKIFRIDEYREK